MLHNRMFDNFDILPAIEKRWKQPTRTFVHNGAKHLDKVKPGWYAQVEPENLDMSMPDSWIAAQITGEAYSDAAEILGLRKFHGGPGEVSGGFVTGENLGNDDEPHAQSYYALLQAHWLAEVEERLNRASSCKYDPKQVNQTEET